MALASRRLSGSGSSGDVTARLLRKTEDVTYHPAPRPAPRKRRCAPAAPPLNNCCESLLRCGASATTTMAVCRPTSYGLLCSFVILLFYGVTRSRQQDNFYFDPSPQDQEVIQGHETRLRCDVSSRKHIRFYWTVNDRPLQNTSRRFQEDSDLRILRVDRAEDSGYFQCIATNMSTGVSLKSRGASLTIFWLEQGAEVQLVKPKSRAEIVPGVEVMLKCQVSGNSEPTVFEWYKNTVRLTANDRRKLISGGRLRLLNVTVQDNGIYSCRAENEAGSAMSNRNYLLNIPANDVPLLDTGTFVLSQLVKKRDEARLTCKFANSIRTEWYFKDKLLKSDFSGKIVALNNGTLLIRDVQDADAGWYRCVGVDMNGQQSQSFMTEVNIAYLNDFVDSSFEPKLPAAGLPLIVPVNQKLEVRCLPPSGVPPPEIRWVDAGGMPVTDGGGRVKADNNGLLSIVSAQQVDAGNYTCLASNLAAVVQRTVSLVVSVAPRIAQPPLSTRVEEDHVALFECKYLGNRYPVSEVTWIKENSPPLKANPRMVINERDGTLRINNVLLSDEGDYACVVTTAGHPPVTSNNAHLYVKKSLKFTPKPSNNNLEYNSKSVVLCKADGQPQPTVSWKKENSTFLPFHVTDNNGVLTFDSVQYTDAGVYTCTASSSQGVITATIILSVVIRPYFKVAPQNTSAPEGSNVLLHCLADGYPKPTTTWYFVTFDNTHHEISNNTQRHKLHSNGSLSIDTVFMEDSGKYQCAAGSAGIVIVAELVLTVSSSERYLDSRAQVIADSFNVMKTVIIAVCSAIAYLAIVIGLAVYCSLRLGTKKLLALSLLDAANGNANGKRDNNGGEAPNEHTELMEKREMSQLKPFSDDARSHLSGGSSTQPSSQSSRSKTSSSIDRLSFPRNRLQTLRMLGKGHYGDVFLAKAFGIVESEPETLVSFKALLSREEPHQFEFRRELEMFARLNHDNVARLLGISREAEPFFLIFEYLEWGDLKQYLLATRPDVSFSQTKPRVPTVAQKMAICSQVAVGMEHLANSRLVHRDLAARNVLLSPTLAVKIGCLSLCHDMYAGEYFRFRQQVIPLRWMPHEAVFEDDYSMKSDVWSFGIFMYEVFSLGDMPYRTRSDDDVVRLLKCRDARVDMPLGCPPEIYQLIVDCTRDNPNERPSFSELAVTLGDFFDDSTV